jgi:hypothetical protein
MIMLRLLGLSMAVPTAAPIGNDGAASAGCFSWTLMPSASTVMSPIS